METMPLQSPWSIYGRGLRPQSDGRILLADLLEFVVSSLGGLREDGIDAIFADRSPEGLAEQASIRSYFTWLGAHCLEGRLCTFVRPLGGGPVAPLPRSSWEIDTFEPRFAFSALDPKRWEQADAAPTHWIFVSEESVDEWWRSWSEGEPELPTEGLQPFSVERQVSIVNPSGVSGLMRIEDVAALTGMSRSTIYDRIRHGSFPEAIRLGTRMSRWRKDDVERWLHQHAGI